MSSGAKNTYNNSFLGVAAEVNVTTCPFRPRTIKFHATGGVWGIKVQDDYGMSGANYLSSTAADVGVTINADGFTVASGADVNVNTERVYYECAD